MMKKMMVAALALMLAVPALADTKIGVVDLRRALFSSDDAQAFSKQLQSEFSDDEQKVRDAQEEARKLKERLEKDGAMMNESERNELSGKFKDKVQEFQYLKNRLDSTVNSRKQKFLEDARPQVDAAVKALLEEHDLDLVLPSEAVVYAKPDMDLTKELIKKLNK
ncbi:OmpH family outer membrane protein [Marinobacter halodurans]|uniref:OmpH family outer membrane protein n=1 Tax=Marinobacter halodurans TaxID=2528979 RepID=A0ABY1ZLH3_9GAMM|nr:MULTISPECIES: OmpH family outer membrane protein [Marinobacter]ROT99283.1 OmpH family outer membrane protein [Marinobacter sp. R17]TBW56674.1 OmpH family outer membrane protein [Marinobacter halodurans]